LQVFTEGCIGVRIMARLCTTLIGTIIIGIDVHHSHELAPAGLPPG
jgi:hypothetical protein